MGIPIFKYSLKSKDIPRSLADSATMRFATEPNKVKLPAKVVDIARVIQYLCVFAQFLIKGSNKRTAGTLEITLLNKAEIMLISAMLLFAKVPTNF